MISNDSYQDSPLFVQLFVILSSIMFFWRPIKLQCTSYLAMIVN